MAFDEWTPVSWQRDDVLTVEKMQRDAANAELLRNTTARARYKYGVVKQTGIRLIGGIAVIGAQTDGNGSTRVNFEEFFTTDCVPIITTGLVSPHGRLHLRIKGLDQLLPDDRGFSIHAQMDSPNTQDGKNRLDSKIYISWIAMGY